MTTKSGLSFQPAPRPQPRTTPEEAERLRAATQDLGFGRPTTAPSMAPAVEPPPITAESPAPTHSPIEAPVPTASEANPRRPPALKFDVPDALWDDLRMAGLKRRVTVKYLVMEALAAKGYAVDLTDIPEDGRRIR